MNGFPASQIGVLQRQKMMSALIKTRPGCGNVELGLVPEPECTAGKVKIEVKFCGICGTDIHVYHDRFRSYPPVILGHEFSGEVTGIGDGVKNIAVDNRVTVLGSSAVVCGRCEYCQQGLYMYCSIRRGMGHGVNGAFTQFVSVREDQVYRLPDSVSLEEGALSEPFASAVQAIEELTSFHPGDVVLLSGPGPIGLLCLMLLVAHRCRVIVAGTEVDEYRLGVASQIGADTVVNVDTDNLQAVVDRQTRGLGVDAVVECAGSAGSVCNCLTAVKKTGKYVQVGILGRDISLPFDQILYKQLQVFGSVGHSLKTWHRVMQILNQRKIDLKPVISHVMPLSRWKDAFDLCENRQGIKILLEYDGC